MAVSDGKLAVALLSGGMDSAVALAVARDLGFDVCALTVRYGQRHAVEIEAARKVAASLGVVRHLVMDLNLAGFGGSALTGLEPIARRALPPGEGGIPNTYVPARNTVFLSLALSWAEALAARDIFTGVSSVDYSGYPDCRPAFIESFERTANLGTKAADGMGVFRIHAPLMKLDKAETVRLGLELGVDFSLTHSCYDPGPRGEPCEECDACVLRRRGFDGAGIDDPAASRGRRG